MSTQPLPGPIPGPGDVFNITAAQRGLSAEQAGRTRRYLVSMLIRTACVISAIFVPGWPRWVLIVGAVTLPYLAVVMANAGRESDEIGALGVGPEGAPRLASGSGEVVRGSIESPPLTETR